MKELQYVMSVTELNELRSGAKKYLDAADEKVVRLVYAMLEANANMELPAYELSPEQETELSEIMDLDEKGQLSYSPWEEVKARIISKK